MASYVLFMWLSLYKIILAGGDMERHIKKYLSYVLVIVLAVGMGISYAYAVGANDSNAFVTIQEYEERVEEIETSINNISKTILDTNMDYVMNGPRLQANLVEGFENKGGTNLTGGSVIYYPYRDGSESTWFGRYSPVNYVMLGDTWDGRQVVTGNIPTYAGDVNNTLFPCMCRFAVKSDTPNVYIILSFYYAGIGDPDGIRVYIGQASYVDLSKEIQDYSQAASITATVPLTEWWNLGGTAGPQTQAKDSAYIYTGSKSDTMFPPYLIYSTNNSATTYNLSNPGTGWLTRAVTPLSATVTFDFPANACIIRYESTSTPYFAWNLFPIDMKGRKYGNAYDQIYVSDTNTTYKSAHVIAKVYSPQKGCLALKSYLNGEIPILNE